MPVVLRFNDLTPHWMVGGRSGSGKTAFLTNVLYGLCTRYGPDELALYLLDLDGKGESFARVRANRAGPSWLPHVRAVGVEADREYGLGRAAGTRRRDGPPRRGRTSAAGVTRFAELAPAGTPSCPGSCACIDEFPLLLAGTDRVATEAAGLLESWPRTGRSYGIHLILCQPRRLRRRGTVRTRRDRFSASSRSGWRCPAADDVLEPTNDSAAGPATRHRGGEHGRRPGRATRCHPRARTDGPVPRSARRPATLAELRHRLWDGRREDAGPPVVFAGYAHQHLADDPLYQSA